MGLQRHGLTLGQHEMDSIPSALSVPSWTSSAVDRPSLTAFSASFFLALSLALAVVDRTAVGSLAPVSLVSVVTGGG